LNKKLKYINAESCHPSKCFKSIPNGVLKQLSKLASSSRTTLNSRLDTLYPAHAKALQKAKLAPSRFPKLIEILRKIEINKTRKRRKEEDIILLGSLFLHRL